MKQTIYLTDAEVEALNDFCIYNLASGQVEVTQENITGTRLTTKVMVKDLPETITDITDIDSW